MIVVSDTSPLNYLQQVGRLNLLPSLFGEVLIPPSVRAEWQRGFGGAPAPVHDWLRVAEPRDRAAVAALRQRVDRGEAEAIILALEQHAELLLIDERDGRALAQERGLTVIGVLGIFVRSKQRGLIAEVRPEIERLLSETNFFCDQPLLNRVLALADEASLDL